MQSEGRFKSHKQYERTKANQNYFDSVVKAFSQLSEYAPVVAVNYDPLASAKKLTPNISNFLCDVEIATKKALKTPALLEQWKKLIEEERVSHAVAISIVNRCARLYRKRNLAPYEYFRVIRKPLQESAAA